MIINRLQKNILLKVNLVIIDLVNIKSIEEVTMVLIPNENLVCRIPQDIWIISISGNVHYKENLDVSIFEGLCNNSNSYIWSWNKNYKENYIEINNESIVMVR